MGWHWNWKFALMSALYRGLLFLAFAFRSGWRAASAALVLEMAYRAFTAGVFGAVTQRLSGVRPAWLGAAACLLILPSVIQAAEYLLHTWAGTPHAAAASAVSTLLTAVSSLFNWYAMRQGAFLAGEGATSLAEDLRRWPSLVYGFLTAWRRL